jgi:hypothetical protein
VTRDTIRDRNMPDREQLERWLFSEEAGQDDAADAAFAHLFAAVPRVEPGPGFIDRTATEAWRLRARRRRMGALAWAASLAIAAFGFLVAYAWAPYLGPRAIKTIAFVTGHSVAWLVAYTTVALDWWWMVARIGGQIAEVIATPGHATALVGVELIGILAFFALQRLVSAERLGDARI